MKSVLTKIQPASMINTKVKKVIRMKNGCCSDLPVMLTTNIGDDGSINYSCQCACNGWHTTGHKSKEEALADYEQMTERALSGRPSDEK